MNFVSVFFTGGKDGQNYRGKRLDLRVYHIALDKRSICKIFFLFLHEYIHYEYSLEVPLV